MALNQSLVEQAKSAAQTKKADGWLDWLANPAETAASTLYNAGPSMLNSAFNAAEQSPMFNNSAARQPQLPSKPPAPTPTLPAAPSPAGPVAAARAPAAPAAPKAPAATMSDTPTIPNRMAGASFKQADVLPSKKKKKPQPGLAAQADQAVEPAASGFSANIPWLAAGGLGLAAAGHGTAQGMASDGHAKQVQDAMAAWDTPLQPNETNISRYSSTLSPAARSAPFGFGAGDILSRLRSMRSVMELAKVAPGYINVQPGQFVDSVNHYGAFAKGPVPAYVHMAGPHNSMGAYHVDNGQLTTTATPTSKKLTDVLAPHFEASWRKFTDPNNGAAGTRGNAGWIEPYEVNTSVIPHEQQVDFLKQYHASLPDDLRKLKEQAENAPDRKAGFDANMRNYGPITKNMMGYRQLLKDVGTTGLGAGAGALAGEGIYQLTANKDKSKRSAIVRLLAQLTGAGIGGAGTFALGTDTGQKMVSNLVSGTPQTKTATLTTKQVLAMINGELLNKAQKTASEGAYGMQNVATQQYTPIAQRRELSPDEQAATDKSENNWLPTIFQNYGTPMPEMLASPAKSGLMGALGGGLLGAGAGGMVGAEVDAAQGGAGGTGTLGGAALGGLAGAGIGGLAGYFGRQSQNEGIKELMTRLPEGARKRDMLADPAVQADMQRQAMMSAAMHKYSEAIALGHVLGKHGRTKNAFELPSLSDLPPNMLQHAGIGALGGAALGGIMDDGETPWWKRMLGGAAMGGAAGVGYNQLMPGANDVAAPAAKPSAQPLDQALESGPAPAMPGPKGSPTMSPAEQRNTPFMQGLGSLARSTGQTMGGDLSGITGMNGPATTPEELAAEESRQRDELNKATSLNTVVGDDYHKPPGPAPAKPSAVGNAISNAVVQKQPANSALNANPMPPALNSAMSRINLGGMQMPPQQMPGLDPTALTNANPMPTPDMAPEDIRRGLAQRTDLNAVATPLRPDMAGGQPPSVRSTPPSTGPMPNRTGPTGRNAQGPKEYIRAAHDMYVQPVANAGQQLGSAVGNLKTTIDPKDRPWWMQTSPQQGAASANQPQRGGGAWGAPPGMNGARRP